MMVNIPLIEDAAKTKGDPIPYNVGVARTRSSNVMSTGIAHEIDALGGTSLTACVCLFVQAIIGGGLLTYPHAYMAGGVANIIVLQAILIGFIAGGLWVLAWCTERTSASTYQALMKKLLGRKAEVACAVAIVVLIFGASVVYLDVCVDQVEPWLTEAHRNCGQSQLWCSITHISANRAVITVALATLLSLLCLRRTMTSLSIPSLLGFCALLYVCFVIMADYIVGAVYWDRDTSAATSEIVWLRPGVQDWLSTLPVICFSYQGHISAVPLYRELQRRSMRRWLVVISIGLVVCLVLYNVTGLLGYLTFVDGTKSDVLQSFTASGYEPNVPRILVSLAGIAVALAVSVTSAVFTFCARSAILDELSCMQGRPQDPPSNAMFLLVTFAWLSLVALASICLPNIGVVVSIMGNICAFFMFHFPGLCMIATAFEDADKTPRSWWTLSGLPRPQWWRALAGWFYISVGTVVFAAGLLNAFHSLM
eukprot:CAMPEP_0117522404 /NCGR_PEP_ID=MMETSP0784-20121206/34189_1 /TAXON_ID=39447 /ORGANISM="" /LENGTH=479 /DNA_ID=CAMNT_0005318473 /DNA_START=9 /DNA_END=1448 /DNA_ORIENTATION=+